MMLTVARFGTRDVARARSFYDPIAAMVGASLAYDRPDMIAYKGADGAMLLIGLPFEGEATVGNGTQAGFMAATRADVDAIHARAIELGGKDEGAPGVRGEDPNGYYGAYFRDLDGNKLTVFRFGPP
jgi:predicted lactoylglutathione lyase